MAGTTLYSVRGGQFFFPPVPIAIGRCKRADALVSQLAPQLRGILRMLLHLQTLTVEFGVREFNLVLRGSRVLETALDGSDSRSAEGEEALGRGSGSGAKEGAVGEHCCGGIFFFVSFTLSIESSL